MKKNKLLSIVYQFASPVALIILGAVLLLFPDSASVLVAQVLGWAMVIAGVVFAVSAVASPGGTAGKVICAVVCLAVGGWLVKNPLVLAKGVGRLVGILLAIRGLQDLFQSVSSQGKLLSLVTAAIGVILILLPMTTSRVVFSLCGLVVLIIGIAMFVDRIRKRRFLDPGDDPNIIDAL
ncbi:MAG: HdeD family acid-resistance protein [Faecousia sp.]